MECSFPSFPRPTFSVITRGAREPWWEYLHSWNRQYLIDHFLYIVCLKVITMVIIPIKFKNMMSAAITLWTLFKNKEIVLLHMRKTINPIQQRNHWGMSKVPKYACLDCFTSSIWLIQPTFTLHITHSPTASVLWMQEFGRNQWKRWWESIGSVEFIIKSVFYL